MSGRGKGGKGLGKGGAKRHRKVLRDKIQGLTKPVVRRLERGRGKERMEEAVQKGEEGRIRKTRGGMKKKKQGEENRGEVRRKKSERERKLSSRWPRCLWGLKPTITTTLRRNTTLLNLLSATPTNSTPTRSEHCRRDGPLERFSDPMFLFFSLNLFY